MLLHLRVIYFVAAVVVVVAVAVAVAAAVAVAMVGGVYAGIDVTVVAAGAAGAVEDVSADASVVAYHGCVLVVVAAAMEGVFIVTTAVVAAIVVVDAAAAATVEDIGISAVDVRVPVVGAAFATVGGAGAADG